MRQSLPPHQASRFCLFQHVAIPELQWDLNL